MMDKKSRSKTYLDPVEITKKVGFINSNINKRKTVSMELGNNGTLQNLFYTIEFKEITSFYFKAICIAQIMRSTFGRIEFYLHTLRFFEVTSLEIKK